ncbi:MAG: hypothetical protein GY715_03110, partial [Planctomycetes bacterium]|nr:hypothetical protein [Planctomycetota bacterium]
MNLLAPLRRPISLVLLAAGAATFAAADTAAQFRPGQVPGPMTTRGLEREARRLRLSTAQVEAVEGHHDTYRAEYDELRRTVFDPYRDAHLSTLVRTMDEADERRRAFERVLLELDAIEEAFFDRVAALLSEEQAARLPSVRARRERRRVREVWPQPFMRGRAATMDLGAVVDDLDLPATSREAAWPFVEAYEQRLTEAVRHLHRTALDIPRRVAAMQLDLQERQRQSLERLREAYDAPLDLPDEERRRWVQERSQDILDEHRELINEQMELQRRAQDGLVDEALALGRLGRTLFHQLADVLPEEAMEAVRERYLYRAYGDLPRNRGPAARLFDQALEL